MILKFSGPYDTKIVSLLRDLTQFSTKFASTVMTIGNFTPR